ncbi:uncharacterized protein PAC_15245 [Phialocephala subalpina]|uniref:Uncharacterized protein n=1 Tax=Phialocephala subalpina TaxID=576137 RepID=A0A1L7XJW3_9HELO|nr:uncharacterized protein PAC_15245 [Phialocephala subalpina]
MGTGKGTKAKKKTQTGTKINPGKKVVRVVNPTKKAETDSKKQKAAERLAKAVKRIEDADAKKADNLARKAELQKQLQTLPEAEQETAKTRLEALDQEMSGVELEINQANEEKKLAQKEQDDVEMEDVTEEQEVDDPDNPKQTTEGSSQKKNKSREVDDETSNDDSDDDNDSDEDGNIEDEDEHVYPDLINNNDIKKGLGKTSGICKGWTKVGIHGKRPVVQLGPNSAPAFRTMKARQFDGIIDPSSEYNLVKQRRCDVRNKDDTKKFTIDDVVGIQGVSYYVEDEYEGNPAEKLKPLPPRLTKNQKAAMKARGEEIPEEKTPEVVQVYVKWKQQYKGKWRTFETRSGIRGLYGDNLKGDKFIYKAALVQEERYQGYLESNGIANSRSASPFVPGNENTPPPEGKKDNASTGGGLLTPGGTPPPGGNKDNASTGGGLLTPGGTPPPGTQTAIKAAKKAAMEEFKEDYLLGAGVDEWKDLTPQQQSDGVEAFRLFWAKKPQGSV